MRERYPTQPPLHSPTPLVLLQCSSPAPHPEVASGFLIKLNVPRRWDAEGAAFHWKYTEPVLTKTAVCARIGGKMLNLDKVLTFVQGLRQMPVHVLEP